MSYDEQPSHQSGAPRWPAGLALLLIGVAYAEISDRLKLFPSSLLLGVLVAGLVLGSVAHLRGNEGLARLLTFSLAATVTVAMIASTLFLVSMLPLQGAMTALVLLRDAVLIWLINMMTFAVWYWEIDSGGPGRRLRGVYASSDFMFLQVPLGERTGSSSWSPGFVDYLFLAFTTSIAFSHTDTAVLSRRAKVLSMIQVLLSLMMAIAALAALSTFT